VALWALVFVAAFGLYIGRPVNRIDEAWMLWLTYRLAHGAVLYRDAYSVTTPIGPWTGALLVRIAGSQVAVLRGLVAASFAAQVACAVAIVRRCGVGVAGAALLAVALFAVASPLVAFASVYSSLATLAALIALGAVLRWYDAGKEGAATHLLVAGAACGAAFWCKPNVGVLIAAATAAAVAANTGWHWTTLRPRLAAVGLGALAVSALVVPPILWTGAWSAFVDQVFLSKHQYVDVGFSYFSAVQLQARRVFTSPQIDPRALVRFAILSTPVVVASVLAWAWWRNGRSTDRRWIGLAAFAVAAVACVYPRPGVNHFVDTMSLTLTCVVGLCALSRRREPSRAAMRTAGVAVLGLLAVVGASVVVVDSVQAYDAKAVRRDLPHFQYVPIRNGAYRQLAQLRSALRSHTDGRVFIAREDAGFLYLGTGVRDPLPYDIAERSDFGGGGERGVIHRLVHDDVRYVCLHPPRVHAQFRSPLDPRTLAAWVRTHYLLIGHYPACDLYRAQPVAGEAKPTPGPLPLPSGSDSTASGAAASDRN